ncbi:MAG: hypothetical protein AB1586_24275 [Pseudomonadota bacterium]
MADDIEDLAKIILGETSGLTASDSAAATVSQDRLWSVVASIAQSARTKGLLGLMRRAGSMVPDDEAASYLLMKAVADKIAQNRYDGPTQLPKQAVLWQLTTDGYPSFQAGKPPAWIFAAGVTVGGDFKDRNGAPYRLYESPKEPDPGKAGWTSSYSSSGLAPPEWSVPANLRKIAWVVGSISAIVFVIGGVSAVFSGQGDGAPRSEARAVATQYQIVDKLADNCIADAAQFPNWKRSICGFLADANGKYAKPAPVAAPAAGAASKPVAAPTTPTTPTTPTAPTAAATPGTETTTTPAVTPSAGATTTPTTTSALTATPVQQVTVPATETKPVVTPVALYGPKVGQTIIAIRKCLNVGLAPEIADTKSKTPPDADAAADAKASCELVARSAADAGLIGAAPYNGFLDGVVNSLLGVRTVPDTRSILVQLLCMTLGIAGLAIALGLGTKGRVTGIWIDERNRISLARAQVSLWTIVALGGFAATALYNVGLAGPVSFPQIPAAIAAALGIAFASPMVSALILNSKTFGTPDDATAQANSLRINISGQSADLPNDPLETRVAPLDASLADVFVGEHVSDAGNVDISRLQNVVLTVTLVLGYLAMLAGKLSGITADTLLTGIDTLPDPGAAFTSVLLVSHATYLATKAYNGTGKPPAAH